MIVGDGQEYTGPPREEYHVTLIGQEDVTAFSLDLYPDEVEVLEKVARVSEQTSYRENPRGPTLHINKAPSIALNAKWDDES